MITEKKVANESSFAHDCFGRMIEKNEGALKNSYTYNAYGQRTGRVTKNGSLTLSETKSYDKFGRLLEIQANGKNVKYCYNTKNQLAEQIVDNIPIEFTYTKYGQLESKILGGIVRPISHLKYIYSKDGMIAGRVVNGKFQMYSYDKKGQLLSVADMNGKLAEQYVYDPAGNILSKTIDGKITTYTYDKANQLLTSTIDGRTTKYAYDAAGRMIKEGEKTYRYGYLDKILSIQENGKQTAAFDYHVDGQIANATHGDKSESFLWDGLALIHRGDTSFVNEPYITGGNSILSSKDGVMFNDMLGSTLNIGGKAVGMTAFGETADKSAMFTGKPYIGELGYPFLFRNYRAEQGKWQTTDPLGYPDGWNNLAYVNNGVTGAIDYLGGATISSLYDALNHYAWGNGEAATVAASVILESKSTRGYSTQLQGVEENLLSQPKSKTKSFLSYNGSFTWDQGSVLGRNTMSFYTSFDWTASNWVKEGDKYVRTLSGTGNILLYTQDDWDFKVHSSDDFWNTFKREVGPNIVANLYSRIVTGARGNEFHMTGSTLIKKHTFSVKQYE